jgi:phage antirepressor YoqD-like protein
MNQLIHLSAEGQPLTTSLVLAEGAGIHHKNALELIKAHVHEIKEFGPIAFETRKGAALPQGGFAKATTVAILNERQATLVLTFFRNTETVRKFKVALVKAFYEMAEKLRKPAFELPDFTDPAAAAEAWAKQFRERKALEAQVVADAPKVAFAEDIQATAKEETITGAAKILGIKPRAFFDWLRTNGYLYKQSTQATAKSIDAGLMVVRFMAVMHDSGEAEKKAYAHVTGKGLFYFYRKLLEDGLIAKNAQLNLAAA